MEKTTNTTLSDILDETRQELIQHGTPEFPIAAYLEDMLNAPIYWHWHKEWEFGVITEGEGIVAMDNMQYRLKKGDFFFYGPEVLHASWSTDPEPFFGHFTVMHPRLVGGSIHSVFWQKYLMPMMENNSLKSFVLKEGDPNRERFAELSENVWNACREKPPGYEFRVRNDLSEMVYLMYELAQAEPDSGPERGKRDETRIKKMVAYVQEHYSEDITLAKLAEHTKISESECLRCFKRMLGISPIQFIKQFRIQRAQTLLTFSTEKIVDIGYECGFRDMSYFAKTFQQQCGCTPSEFRQKTVNNLEEEYGIVID